MELRVSVIGEVIVSNEEELVGKPTTGKGKHRLRVEGNGGD